jgi:hypothetical protein
MAITLRNITIVSATSKVRNFAFILNNTQMPKTSDECRLGFSSLCQFSVYEHIEFFKTAQQERVHAIELVFFISNNAIVTDYAKNINLSSLYKSGSPFANVTS